MESLEQKEYINLLLDCYQELLTKHQQDVMILYYQEDLSLSEIADNLGISRNAVYDLLKRSCRLLEEYETKLHLSARHRQRTSLIEKIEANDKIDHQTLLTYLEQIKQL